MARVPSSGSETPASASALAALADEIERFPDASRTRGARYAREDRVGPINRSGGRFAAIVRGTSPYATSWTWRAAAARWTPGCSCPVAPRCKHAYALARRVLDDATGMPSAERSGEARSHRPLDRLRTRDLWERHLALDLLLADAPISVSSHEPPLEEALREADPDLRCWRLARELARRTGGWVPRALAPFRERADLAARHLARVRHGLADDLTAWAARREPTPVRSVRLVFGLLAGPDGAPRVTVEARVATPRAGETARSAAQLRQLRSDLLHAPETFGAEQAELLEWLVAHDVGGREAFRQEAPWLVTHVLRGLLERLGPTVVATWAPDLPPALAARGGIVGGAPIVVRPEPLRLLPACVERGGELWLELRFQGESGEQHGLDEVIYLRGTDPFDRPSPGLAIAGGAFARVVEEPPPSIVDRFLEARGIPVAAEERVATVGRLAARFPHLRDALASHTRVHAVTPAVALDLRDDDWLQVRLFAHGGGAEWQPGEALPAEIPTFEYGPDRAWERRSAPSAVEALAPIVDTGTEGTPPPADPVVDAAPGMPGAGVAPAPAATAAPAAAWLEIPDPRHVEPVTAWLHGLPLHPGTRRGPGGHAVRWPDRDIGWWMRATRRGMEALADAWDERPAGVTWFGTAAVRRLLGGARVAARLRVTPSGMDWFAVAAEWRAEGMALTGADVAALRAATTRFVKLPSGWAAKEALAAQAEVAELFADLGLDATDSREQRVSLWQLAGGRPETIDALVRIGADPETRAAVETLRARIGCFTGIPPVAAPPGLVAELRPYQAQGLAFLAHASSLGLGAVLADDMGLGKTVQALAWLAHLVAEDRDGGPSLVVCPASVVHNWEREAARFTPHLRVLTLTSGGDRHDHWHALARQDLVITTYALLRRDAARWKEVRLRAAILDEAQNVKNPDAAVTRAAHALDARHRLALTGTPLENRALDLWSIVSAVEPGYLGGRTPFSRRFDRPDAPASTRTLLAAKLRPLLLRRTKAQVAPELPERIEERRDCALTAGQRRLYVAELARSRQLVRDLEDAPGGVGRHKIAVLAALTRLRQICCHPALVGGRPELGSGKFAALFELLEPLLAEGHKVLLFSQFVQCLKLLRAEIQARGIAHHVLTGQTTRRAQVVADFQEDPRPGVFLVSLKAGGTGLNLTAASYVVLFDPWWNPAVEAQAIDRAHRIGQDRTVIAYRMLARGTVEERIWELQRRKAALTRDVLGEDGFARALDRAALEYLLTDVAGDDVEDDEPARSAQRP